MEIITGILGILVFLLVLSLVIIIHELGHFLAARRAGILCHEFSLGMGPVIWSKKKGETVYSIRAFPLGGYVSMAGEEVNDEVIKVGDQVRVVFNENKNVCKLILDHESEKWQEYELITVEKIDLVGHKKDGFFTPLYINGYAVARNAMYVVNDKEIQIAPADRNFNTKNKRQRFLAIFGGPFMNFVLAFIIFVIFGLVRGFPAEDSTNIGTVGMDSPVEGIILEGDVITHVNGIEVFDWDDLVSELDQDIAQREIDLRIFRSGEVINDTVIPTLYFYSIGFNSELNNPDELVIGSYFGDNERNGICLTDNVDIDGCLNEKYETLMSGDIILEIDEVVMNDWTMVVEAMGANINGSPIDLKIQRGSEVLLLTVTNPWSEEVVNTQGLNIVDSRIGIGPTYTFDLVESVKYGFVGIGNSSTMIFDTLKLLFDNDQVGVGDLAGPLGIYQITNAALAEGMVSLLAWMGLLSVNLGVINLLPIPALDGGRLVFLGYEALSGHKPNQKVENTLHYVMYLLLMGLFVYITYNDLLRLLGV